jgi:spore coat protein U-like protein
MKKLIVVLSLLFLSQQASALCIPGICSCNIVTTGVAFGAFNPLTGTSHDSNGNVAFSCTGNPTIAGLLIPYTIALSKGGGATYATRRMASGTRYLTYNLYTDSAHSIIWGDGTGGSSTAGSIMLLDLLGLGATINYPIYGRVTSGQTTAVPGIYADTITVTVTYN